MQESSKALMGDIKASRNVQSLESITSASKARHQRENEQSITLEFILIEKAMQPH